VIDAHGDRHLSGKGLMRYEKYEKDAGSPPKPATTAGSRDQGPRDGGKDWSCRLRVGIHAKGIRRYARSRLDSSRAGRSLAPDTRPLAPVP
jgi:hypothetical protein